MLAVGAHVKDLCGSVNLCAGIKSFIEGGIHVVHERELLRRLEMEEEQKI